MYVSRRNPTYTESLPPNYRGSLLCSEIKESNDCDCQDAKPCKFTIKRNTAIATPNKAPQSCDKNTDDIILIGALAFLYIGCEHTKDNIILILILAYLLFFCKND